MSSNGRNGKRGNGDPFSSVQMLDGTRLVSVKKPCNILACILLLGGFFHALRAVDLFTKGGAMGASSFLPEMGLLESAGVAAACFLIAAWSFKN